MDLQTSRNEPKATDGESSTHLNSSLDGGYKSPSFPALAVVLEEPSFPHLRLLQVLSRELRFHRSCRMNREDLGLTWA